MKIITINRQDILASCKIKRLGSNLVRVGAVYGDTVLNRAATFDSDLHNFNEEWNDNEIFSKRLYDATGFDPEKKKALLAFMSEMSAIDYDWQGTPDTAKTSPDYYDGYYNQLKAKWLLTDSDLREVLRYDERLRNSIKTYNQLGYKTSSNLSPTEKELDKKLPTDTGVPSWVYWLGGGAVLIALAVTLSPSINALVLGAAK